MKTFAYTRPDSPEEAVTRLASAHTSGHPARYLGGGTNLVDLMKLGVERPDLLVDVSRLLDPTVTLRDDGTLRIGAGVRNADLAASRIVREHYPVISRALLAGASGQLRIMATTGGNLLQRTRCTYFQDVSKPCNKREPGSGCPARAGDHRNLAVLGASEHCVATHPSDLAVALLALDASVQLRTTDDDPAGSRGELALDDLYRLPGDSPERDTNLPAGALITGVTVPSLPFASRSTYRKVRDRASYAFALASVAAALDVAPDGTVRHVRIALGAVAHRPWRARLAEARLRGAPATPENFTAAVEEELAAAQPLRDNGFKVPLVRRLVVRTLTDLTTGAAA